MPFACVGRTGPGLPQHWVDIDNAAAEAQSRGVPAGPGLYPPRIYRLRIRNYWDAEREAGYRAGLASRGIPGEGVGLLRIEDASAHARIRSFMSSARPDAVVTGSDKIATIVYSAAAELNHRRP